VPTTAEELIGLLDIERIDANLFRGQQPDTGMQRVFGGQVAAQALIAAHRTVDDDRWVHSLHSYFLRPGDTTVPIVYDVENLRDGSSFSTRRVVARQHGRPIYIQSSSFQVDEPGLEHQDRLPHVVDPEKGMPLSELVARRDTGRPGEWEREWGVLDIRYVGNSAVGGIAAEDDPTRPTRAQLWVRVDGSLPDDRVTQAAAFTYASDLTLIGSALVPHDKYVTAPGMQVASLDHTLWFHRPFRADDWWLYDQFSPSASGARGLALARVFTRSGELVASVAQEGLIRDHSLSH
jgi:acyl-CoA thioesterase-2